MKILHLIIFSPLHEDGGGRETWLQYFIPNIKNYYDSIYIYSLYDENMMKFSDIKNVEIVPLSSYKSNKLFRYFIFIKNIKKIINNINGKCRNDVLSLGTIHEGFLLYKLKIKLKNKVNSILWLRNMGTKERNYKLKKILDKVETKALQSADYIIANGWDTKDYYQKKVRKEIKVIPNAVDVSIYSNLEISNNYTNKMKIAYLGRFTEVKGFNFFESLSLDLTLKEYYQFEAWGWGEINNLNIYKGKYTQKELLTILKDIDIIVLLNSTNKYSAGGISHSLLEAMNAGKIIIAWDNYTHNQILNENNSFLVDEGNYECLRDVLIKIKNMDPELLNAKRKKAREDSMNFSIENHINSYVTYLGLD